MKNIMTLLLAILFSAGMAFAQNGHQATIDQTGDGNDASAAQTGNGNEAEIEQVGDINDGFITQDGTSHEGTILQIGEDNEVNAVQMGSGNVADILQGLDPDRTANNNVYTLTQDGVDNYALFDVAIGDRNVGTVVQNGSDNFAAVIQGYGRVGNPDDEVNDNTASISQWTSDNDARIFQFGGDHNEAYITQNGGNDNNAQVSQGYLWEVHGLVPVDGYYNEARMNQDGASNNATVMQLGENNIFELNQFGNENYVGQKGQVQDGNQWFLQQGDGNRFRGVSENNGELSYDWTIFAEQNNGATLDNDTEGIDGYYGSFQNGDDNRIGLRQGMDDWALIQQLGNSNTALLYQFGVDRNEATILQNGNSNQASVFQTN